MNKTHYLLTFISIISLSACDHYFDTDSSLSEGDIIAILQTALNDSSLIAGGPGQLIVSFNVRTTRSAKAFSLGLPNRSADGKLSLPQPAHVST